MRLFSRLRIGTRHSGARGASAVNSSALAGSEMTSHVFPRRASSRKTGALAESVSRVAGNVPEIAASRPLPDSR